MLEDTKPFFFFQERVNWARALSSQYSKGETDIIFFQCLEEVLKINKVQVLLERCRNIGQVEYSKLETILGQLTMGKPIQYILGYSEFYNRKFKVSPNVLIPRPETEELVGWVLEDFQTQNTLSTHKTLKVLDIGTGSGCIPITLDLEFSFLEIPHQFWGLDLSDLALEIARENNMLLGAKVKWILGNIMRPVESWQLGNENLNSLEPFHILISNPPYIPLAQKMEMDIRVKNFEPSMALFVPDSDPLHFYRAILQFARIYLKGGGYIYFEINEKYALEINQLGKKYQFEEGVLRMDFYGRPRMMRFRKPE